MVHLFLIVIRCVLTSVPTSIYIILTIRDYFDSIFPKVTMDDVRSKIKKTLGSVQPKKRKTKGRGRKKVEEVEMEESSSDSDTPQAEIVDDDMEEEEITAGTIENKSNKKKPTSKASAKKKSSAAKASKPSKKNDSSSPDDDLIAQIRGNALARCSLRFIISHIFGMFMSTIFWRPSINTSLSDTL